MPSNPRLVLAANGGANYTLDKRITDGSEAQSLINLSTSIPGTLRGNEQPKLLFNLAQPIQALGYYYGTLSQTSISGVCGVSSPVVFNDPVADDLLAISDGALYASEWANPPAGIDTQTHYYPVQEYGFSAPALIDFSTYWIGIKKPQFLQYRDEMVILGSLYGNYRYVKASVSGYPTSGHVYPLGQCVPATGGINGLTATPVTVGGGGKTGTVYYAVTITDEKGRESDLSPNAAVTFSGGNNAANLSFGPYIARSWEKFINFYVTTTGSVNTRYLINSQAMLGAATYTFQDTLTDALVQGGRVAAHVGANLPPTLATVGAIHKQRLWLNDFANRSSLQCSNFDSITQFNAVGYNPSAPIPTDGLRFTVGTENDAITSLVSFGDVLYVFKERGVYAVYGDDASNFTVVPVSQSRGCVVQAGAVRCENSIVFTSEDGIYETGGQGFQKISKPIESLLQGLRTPSDKVYHDAVVGYFNRKFSMWIDNLQFIYDFESYGSSKWSLRSF